MLTKREYFSRSLAAMLLVSVLLALCPLMTAHAADDIDVFYGKDKSNANKVVAIQVTSGTKLNNIKIGVERLRKAGYNAYIYQEKGSSRFRIMVGVFSSKEEAAGLRQEIRNGSKVDGMDVTGAYTSDAYISDQGVETYSDPYYGSSSGARQSKEDDDIDVFYGVDKANANKIVAVQVTSGTKLNNIKIGVERLRKVGYNAYIYQEKGSSRFRIMVGVFNSKEDAKDLQREIKNGAKVDGMDVTGAYTTDAYISDWGKSAYNDPYFTPGKKTETSEASSKTELLYGSLLSWSADEIEVELMTYKGLNSKDNTPVYKTTETIAEYNISNAKIWFADAWGDDGRFSSLDKALKHEIDGLGCNIKEAQDGSILMRLEVKGGKVASIVFLRQE